MKGMLSEIIKQNALGKFALGQDFIIVPNIEGRPGEETIKWIGSEEGQKEFEKVRKQSKRELIDALAPNGQYVNTGAKITIQAFAPNEYKEMYGGGDDSENIILSKSETIQNVKYALVSTPNIDKNIVLENIMNFMQVDEQTANQIFEEAQQDLTAASADAF